MLVAVVYDTCYLSIRLHSTTAHKTIIIRSTAMRVFSNVCECHSCNVVIYSVSYKMLKRVGKHFTISVKCWIPYLIIPLKL